MRYGMTMIFLLLAAVLEVGGDAFIRAGLHSTTTGRRALFFLTGCSVLAAYGYTVNAPPWSFGRLLGAYIALFFLISQVVAWVGFGQKPTLGILCGGVLIITGGVVISIVN